MVSAKPLDLRIANSYRPNMPAINETTLPLIATVLAGFSVTIIAQVFIRSEAYLDGKSPNDLLITGLILLSLSVPCFLNTVSFSIWAQSYNYLNLSEESRDILLITEGWPTYIARLQKKWRLWHQTAIVMFYVGSLLFDIGTGLLLLNFIGRLATFLFYGVSALPLIYSLYLLIKKEPDINLEVPIPLDQLRRGQGTDENHTDVLQKQLLLAILMCLALLYSSERTRIESNGTRL
jgi:hypothetical protein